MQVRTFTPSLPLLRFVEAYLLIEDDDPALVPETILPGPNTVLGFQYRGRVAKHDAGGSKLLSTAGVTGIQCRSRQYEYRHNAQSLIVRFRPDGATVLGVPPEVLRDTDAALSELLSPCELYAFQERLDAARADSERIQLIERFLVSLLPNARLDPLVTHGIKVLQRRLLTKSFKSPCVRELTQAFDISERQLERRFLRQVGVGPKRLEALLRFSHIASQKRAAKSLAELALEAGYFDESHFVRDFKRFSGLTPGAYFGRR